MDPNDLFLPLCLRSGPFFGQILGFLHYGRGARPVRWGQRNRGFASTVFSGTDGGSGGTAYGDPAVIEGPGPIYGTDDDTPESVWSPGIET